MMRCFFAGYLHDGKYSETEVQEICAPTVYGAVGVLAIAVS